MNGKILRLDPVQPTSNTIYEILEKGQNHVWTKVTKSFENDSDLVRLKLRPAKFRPLKTFNLRKVRFDNTHSHSILVT